MERIGKGSRCLVDEKRKGANVGGSSKLLLDHVKICSGWYAEVAVVVTEDMSPV